MPGAILKCSAAGSGSFHCRWTLLLSICQAGDAGSASHLPRSSALIRTLADLIGEEVQAAPGIRAPFAFYGHSMGAGISFELARELRHQHGIEPAHLFVC
jgi:alpha-beta hydrolase superfamily lysophospholipase